MAGESLVGRGARALRLSVPSSAAGAGAVAAGLGAQRLPQHPGRMGVGGPWHSGFGVGVDGPGGPEDMVLRAWQTEGFGGRTEQQQVRLRAGGVAWFGCDSGSLGG